MKKRNKREIVDHRKTPQERIVFAVAFLVLAIWAAIVLYMFFWAVISALKTNLAYIREPLQLPELSNLQWSNFNVAINKLNYNGVGFVGMLINSLWLVIGSTFIGTFTICVTGYVFAQYDFPGKNFLLSLVLFVMIIPIYGSLPANYKLIYDLGWNDSFLYLLVGFSGFNSNMMITYGFFKGLSRDYREAVYMDGGSDFTAFFSVGMPMAKNIFVAFFLIHFIAGWNNYETPMLYFDRMPNLALGLYYFQQEIVYESNNPAYFAGALIAMLPVLVLFILYSDKIMGKMYTGGLKG